jgi:hypothetical protein
MVESPLLERLATEQIHHRDMKRIVVG